MAKSILFTSNCQLFGVNVMNSSEKQLTKMQRFEAQQAIQPQILWHFENLGYDFVHDGFRFENVSENLLEVI